MAKFSWCMESNHSACKGSFRHWWFETRKRKETIVFGEDVIECSCKCHGKKSTKTRNRKRKS